MPLLAVLALLSTQTPATPHTCLAFVTTELAKGAGNFYEYYKFSDRPVTIQAGDVLVYDIFLDPKDPSPKGGIDCEFTDNGTPLRDMGLVDQNGIRAHGDGILTPAVGHWYTRRIPLDQAKGRTINSWEFACEGDEPGRYSQFIDNVYVEHAASDKAERDSFRPEVPLSRFAFGSPTSLAGERGLAFVGSASKNQSAAPGSSQTSRSDVYTGGPATAKEIVDRNGYTENPSCVPVDRAKVTETSDLEAVITSVEARALRDRRLDEARKDIDVVRKFLKKNPDPATQAHVEEATAMLNDVEQRDASPEEIEAVLHAAQHALSHTHPMMEKYTGHLVGHAHIDLQWLWEWQEGIIAARDTFNQATKFMDEYPGFSFSQSSSCLYQTVEDNYPAIFKKIQEKVKSGQWEIVGGRVCEGDTNMISPESHARHFLYGQRYFREKFGKTAVVGWEPDTFGHTIQMPQILKLGGCKYYYFCRGGKGKPLFWWKGLDGTQVLAFDEPANGSWYNSDLSYKQFDQMLNFDEATGSKDMLWVYGIGNHGGGPSREYIETALAWMKDPSKPKVKFSTATQFFHKLETYNLSKIPVVNEELNPVFDGCYTSHSEIKQLNRQSEYATMSAEAVATVATTAFGFHYPGAAFRKNWEDICFNHHHDTLPGSGIHPPYERTKTVLGRVLADDKDIATRALETMSIHFTPEKGGMSVMVFNPSGWIRSGWVKTWLVTSGFSGDGLDPSKAVAYGPSGDGNPVELLEPVSRLARFYASGVPAYGYKVFHITDQAPETFATGHGHDVGPSGPLPGPNELENRFLRVELDPDTGTIKSVFDKRANKELVAPGGSFGRLEYHFENPGGMSAWVLGTFSKVEPLKVTSTQPGSFTFVMPAANNAGKSTTMTETFHLDGPEILVDVDCDWQNIGTDHTANPMLRVAFDANLQSPTATYEVPFGALSRPTDGREGAALNWGDLCDAKSGVSILNDSKSGYSADGHTIRLSLIRSSFSPDPEPNPGMHHWRYAILPHGANWQTDTIKAGMELQQPLMAATIPFDAQGKAPKEFSLARLSQRDVIPTGLKLGEDAGDLVLRFYEGSGRPSDGSLSLGLPGVKADWVNFVEDELGQAPLAADRVPLKLHPYEIRNVKVKLNGTLPR